MTEWNESKRKELEKRLDELLESWKMIKRIRWSDKEREEIENDRKREKRALERISKN